MSVTVRLRLALGTICLVGLWLTPLFVPGVLAPFTPAAWVILYAQNLFGYSLTALAPIGAVLIVVWGGYRPFQTNRLGAWTGLVLATGVVTIAVHVVLCLVTTPLIFVPAVDRFFVPQTGGGDVANLRGIGMMIGWPFLAMTIVIPATTILILATSVPLLSRRAHQIGAEAHEIVLCALLLLTLFWAMAQGFKSVNDDRGQITALGVAAQRGHAVAVRQLLRAGADPNRKAGPHIGAPLQLAAMDNNDEIVTALLRSGARDTDGQALIAASAHANPTMVRDLLAAKAPVNARNWTQKTPLIVAAGAIPPSFYVNEPGFRVDEVVSLLVKAGADVNARDSSGETALDAATRLGRESVVKILTAADAKPH